jgi:hypothetical protein
MPRSTSRPASHALDLAVAIDFGGVGLRQDGLAAPLQLALEQPAGRLVQLALHQRGHQVDDSHLHAPQAQAMRGFEAEQAAADDHRRTTGVRRLQHPAHVIHVAEGDDAGQVLARNRDDEGIGPGGQQQAIIALGAARAARDGLLRAIDGDDGIARDQRDAIVRIPVLAVDDDVLEGLLAGQQRGQHDAVVVHPRFRAEDGDAEPVRIAGEDFLDGPATGHAVADDDEMWLVVAGF